MRLPPCVPDHLWLVVRKGWTLAMGLVAAIRARCPQLERGVQADAIGLSLRTFGVAERALNAEVSPQDPGFLLHPTLRQRLSTAQLRGMAGKQIRSRVAAAIVETAVDAKGWKNKGAAAVAGVDVRTIRRARKCGRTNRAQRRLLEADAPIMVPEREVPTDPAPWTPGPGRLSPSFHERTQSLRLDPEPDSADPETSRGWEVPGLPVSRDTEFVPAWKVFDLVRGLSLAKHPKRLEPWERRSGAAILADLRHLEQTPEWRAGRDASSADRDRHRPRTMAARLLLSACDVHTHGHAEKRAALADVIAASGATLEPLLRVAVRLAKNPNVASVGAVFARVEIGRWLVAHGVDREELARRCDLSERAGRIYA